MQRADRRLIEWPSTQRHIPHDPDRIGLISDYAPREDMTTATRVGTAAHLALGLVVLGASGYAFVAVAGHCSRSRHDWRNRGAAGWSTIVRGHGREPAGTDGWSAPGSTGRAAAQPDQPPMVGKDRRR
jgi:hypothetical protein